MKEYIVSVLPYDGHRGYFVGESETTTIDAPISCWSGNSFHVARRDMARLLFSDYLENAKRMTRKNLMSYMNRILDQMHYWTVEIKAILIEEVRDEQNKD